MSERPTVNQTFRITKADRKTLEVLAKVAKGGKKSVGKLINLALAEYAEARGRKWEGTGSWGGERRGAGFRKVIVEEEP